MILSAFSANVFRIESLILGSSNQSLPKKQQYWLIDQDGFTSIDLHYTYCVILDSSRDVWIWA